MLDNHAPSTVKTVVLRPKVNDGILEEKRKKRKAEKRWLKSRTDKDWKDYRSARNSYSFLLYEARKAHHRVLVSENKENPNQDSKIYGAHMGFVWDDWANIPQKKPRWDAHGLAHPKSTKPFTHRPHIGTMLGRCVVV